MNIFIYEISILGSANIAICRFHLLEFNLNATLLGLIELDLYLLSPLTDSGETLYFHVLVTIYGVWIDNWIY
jgi:hypothetical protein